MPVNPKEQVGTAVPAKILLPIYIGVCVLLFNRCAQMQALSGGDKDVLAPTVVKQSPENKTLNFNGSEIRIEFNEYIQLRDVQNQLIITPRLSKDPETEASGKILKLKFKESLQPNTTYNVNFGSCVSDLTEGNAFTGLAVIFSTGPVLDSLSVSGTINNAYAGKPAGDVSVFLYNNANDSAVFNRKPDYFGKADKQGNYFVNYIKPGNYKIVAIEDKNKNFLYGQADELISNYVQKQMDSSLKINFSVFKEIPARFFVKRTSYPAFGQVMYVFNKAVQHPEVEFVPDSQTKLDYFTSAEGDTLRVFYKKEIKDSVSFLLKENGKVLDTLYVYRQDNEKLEKDLKQKRLAPKLSGFVAEPGMEGSVICMNQPLIAVNNDRIKLVNGKDTLPLKDPYRISDRHTDLYSMQKLAFPFKGSVILLPGAVTSIGGFENDSIQYKYEVKANEEFGTITLKLNLPDEETYFLQLVNDRGVEHSTVMRPLKPKVLKEEHYVFGRVAPGNYILRLVRDENKDGRWTSGELLKNTAPEKVYYYDKPLKVLADWEMSVDWKVE